MAEALLRQGNEARQRLADQNAVLAGRRSTMQLLSQQMPDLSQLMQRIRMRRNKNTLITGGAIATGILFLLWWWWTS